MEAELIAWLKEHLPRHRSAPLGLEDDAALIQLAQAGGCVATVDTVTDQVDFVLDEVGPRRTGRKALAVNLSDLAAMAARPVAALVSLVLPRSMAVETAIELFEGMLPLAERYDLAMAGGDTNSWDGPLAISITCLGQAGPGGLLRRSGARPGDVILVTGCLGGSLLGRHLDFEPRVEQSLELMQQYSLHAGMDISDGLSLDLSRMAQASRCGAELRLADIPVAPAAHELARRLADGRTALEHALADGEDFELLLAAPAGEAARLLAQQPLDVPLTAIGHFIDQPGLWQLDEDGARRPLEARGYEH